MKHLILLLTLFSGSSLAVDSSALTHAWQHTPFELYLTPEEAYELKMAQPNKVSLIDVRNEAEIHYTGIPTISDVNIPYRFDSNVWKMKKSGVFGTFVMPKNEYFSQAVSNFIQHRNLDKDSPIIIMCATGTRAPFAAKALHKAGFTNVYTQIEGFEGRRAKSGPNKGKRVIEGWKNAQLPWTYDLIPEKMYYNFSPKLKD